MGETNYKIIKLLGNGSYGSVYLAKSKSSQNAQDFVAIKKFQIKDRKSFVSYKNEINIFNKIKSDYLVKILDYYQDKNYVYIVMEYAPEGDLEGYIRRFFKNNKKIDYKFIDTVIYQVTEGLNELHKNNIIHRDIKTSNILVFDNGLVKITDFGVSKLLDEKNVFANTSIGTPYYMSPEIVNGTPYNYSVDFWALGCLIFKMLTNKYPFEAPNMSSLFYKIIHGKYSLSRIPDKYRDIISKLLNDKFHRANQNDLQEFLLSNCTTFIKKNKKSNNIDKNINKSMIPLNLEKQKIDDKLDPIYKKLNPINEKYKLKLQSKIKNISEDKINKPMFRFNEIYKNPVKPKVVLEPIYKKGPNKIEKNFIKMNIRNVKRYSNKKILPKI